MAAARPAPGRRGGDRPAGRGGADHPLPPLRPGTPIMPIISSPTSTATGCRRAFGSKPAFGPAAASASSAWAPASNMICERGRALFRSSDSAPAGTLYARCKASLFERLAERGGDFAWARVFFVYGPGDRGGRLIPFIVAGPGERRDGRARSSAAFAATMSMSTISPARLSRIALVRRCGGRSTPAPAPRRRLADIFRLAGEARRTARPGRGERPGGPASAALIEADMERFRAEIGEPGARPLRQGLGGAARHEAAATPGSAMPATAATSGVRATAAASPLMPAQRGLGFEYPRSGARLRPRHRHPECRPHRLDRAQAPRGGRGFRLVFELVDSYFEQKRPGRALPEGRSAAIGERTRQPPVPRFPRTLTVRLPRRRRGVLLDPGAARDDPPLQSQRLHQLRLVRRRTRPAERRITAGPAG